MIKSLRWRLQMWHAVILLIAVSLFASAFYIQLRRSTFDEIDLELLSGARVLEGTLRALPMQARDEMLRDIPLNLPPPPDPRGHPGPGGPPNQGRDGRAMPPPLERVGFPRRSPAYFAIFSPEGNMLRTSALEHPVAWIAIRHPMEYRNVEGRREVWLRGPNGTLIVVGREVEPEMNRLRDSLWQLLLIGTTVLVLGLCGGWWLAGNAIRPIQRISQTAAAVSATSLSERIDTVAMDAELQSLASVLNSMLDRLEHSFQQQTQFTADASHELRTPIAVLLSHCELALGRPRTVDEYRQALMTCQKAGQRTKSLVDGLLTLARADAGKLELQKTKIDLRLLVAEAVAMFAPLAGERQVSLTSEGDSSICHADAERTMQVISNLLHNAILYNHPNGEVWLETSVADGFAILKVRDNGPGIPFEVQGQLFDRFFRVDEARSRPAGGSGLGLAICKSIVDAHAGHLTVASQLGEGCVFELRLPVSIP